MQAEEVAWDNECVLSEPHVENAIIGLQKYLEDTGILHAEEQQDIFRNPYEKVA